MDISKEFGRYMEHLAQGLGHADRHAGLSGYCTGLMLPPCRIPTNAEKRKSVSDCYENLSIVQSLCSRRNYAHMVQLG